eukprot:812676-Pelagomonas_calceolata.AAC.1
MTLLQMAHPVESPAMKSWRGSGDRPSQSHLSSTRLRYLPDLESALTSHMHAKHKPGYANSPI